MPRGVNDFDTGRIQGRNVGDANSSNIVSPGIVTDGLVLHLDAGNYQSYPIAGTSWYDLSGYGNNGTLTNGPTYVRDGGGAIDFDGTNDYVTGPITNLSVYTLCVFMMQDAFKSGGGIIGGSNTSIYIQMGGVTDSWQFENAVVSSSDWLTTGKWTYLCGVQNSSNIQQAYKDGVLAGSATAGSVALGTSYAIARRPIGLVHSNIKVAIAQIYDRALSGQEILQNFNATRSRFNI